MAYGDDADPLRAIGRDKLIAKLDRFDKELDGHWGKWKTEAKSWYDMVAGEQWDTDALAQYAVEGRNPIVMNRVDPMVSAISGAEITNRQEVKYSPRELGDVQINELYSGAVKWCRDETDAGDEESQAFRDAIICGVGVTETRMSYDDDPQGMAIEERVDPFEVLVDPNARKSNFVDKKYLRRDRLFTCEEAEVLFPALFQYAKAADGSYENPHENTHGDAYRNGVGDRVVPKDMVQICEYQWREIEAVVRVVDPQTGQPIDLGKDQLEKLKQGGIDPLTHPMLRGVRMKRTIWKRAFRAGGEAYEAELPDGEFTYKFITGKLDRNKGLPYGIVRAMVDPQRWSNKFLAQIDRILSVNAKGGIMVEADAFEDMRKAQEDWARADSMIITAPDALSRGKIVPKPPQPYPQGMDRLFQIAIEAIPQVTGVNAEMLGMAEREQPGVLEYQRKQAAYGVLAVFFDSLKRFRKLQGRLHLKLIAKYMSDERLIRITNPSTGQKQYVPLTHDPDVAKYDVIVDEAPAGPNQVERTWQALIASGPVLKELLATLPPEIVLDILEYSPFPSSLVEKMREKFGQMQQQQAQQQQQMQPFMEAMQQAQLADMQGGAMQKQSAAQLNMAKAQGAQVDAQMKPLEVATAARNEEMNFQQAAWERQTAMEDASRNARHEEESHATRMRQQDEQHRQRMSFNDDDHSQRQRVGEEKVVQMRRQFSEKQRQSQQRPQGGAR